MYTLMKQCSEPDQCAGFADRETFSWRCIARVGKRQYNKMAHSLRLMVLIDVLQAGVSFRLVFTESTEEEEVIADV